jgi:hypothetical protein
MAGDSTGDPRANIVGMDFESAAVGLDAFAAQHANLSANPDFPSAARPPPAASRPPWRSYAPSA